jgi:hypothetical protein
MKAGSAEKERSVSSRRSTKIQKKEGKEDHWSRTEVVAKMKKGPSRPKRRERIRLGEVARRPPGPKI